MQRISREDGRSPTDVRVSGAHYRGDGRKAMRKTSPVAWSAVASRSITEALMPRALVAIVTFVALAAGITAQSAKPSLAGTWKLTSDASAGMFVASQLVTADDGKVFTVTATAQFGENKTVYNLDGTEAKSPLDINGMTIDRTTKAAWEGAKLVLTTKSDFNGMSFEIKQVWSLETDGTLVVESTVPDFQGGGAPTTTKATYKKS
jgi:hypothetical protein